MFHECLGRSGNVSLNVRLTSVRYLPDIAPHLPRFSALEIHVVAPEQISKIASHFSGPAPVLRRLSISAAPQAPIDLSVPRGIFGGDFASLRTLQLAGLPVLKPHQPFPQLTRFEFRTHAHAALRTGAMVEALKKMLSLEVLHVEFCPSHDPPPPPKSLRFVILPKLREVELTTFKDPLLRPPAFIPPLLSVLSLPSVEQITIGMLPPAGSVPLPGSFKERLPNLAETETVDIYLSPLRFNVSFHGLRGSRLLFTTNCGPQNPFQREAFCGTPFLSVKKMVVTFDISSVHSPDPEKYFFELLQVMEQLEYLEIRGQCARLLTVWSGGWYLMDQRSICPSLQSLVVVKRSGDSVSELLAELAMVRRSCGVRLFEVVEVVSDE